MVLEIPNHVGIGRGAGVIKIVVVSEDVPATPTDETISKLAADEDVIARLTFEMIGSAPARKIVVAYNRIVIGPAEEIIRAVAAKDLIVAVAPKDPIDPPNP
jgi:hypothetical protein